jgi:hypothetical protein
MVYVMVDDEGETRSGEEKRLPTHYSHEECVCPKNMESARYTVCGTYPTCDVTSIRSIPNLLRFRKRKSILSIQLLELPWLH